jgi:hypothetical protein
VAAYQTTYDRAAVGGGLERLTLASWRAQRLAASVKALRVDLTRADTDTEDEGEPSALAALWA